MGRIWTRYMEKNAHQRHLTPEPRLCHVNALSHPSGSPPLPRRRLGADQMAAVSTSAPFPAPLFSGRRLQAKKPSQGRGSSWDARVQGLAVHPLISSRKLAKRQTLVYAVNQDAEKSFKRTLEVDRLIDTLRDSNTRELEKLVVENILAFDESFWIRLAARSDTCKSDDDKKDYEELAATVMNIVDLVVHKTKEKIESATDVLKAILKPVVDDQVELSWPPRDPKALLLLNEELTKREQEGQLDEGFLSEVNAQLRQATEDGDKPGLVAMLQKVLQLYASKILCKRSYAYKGNEVLKAEKLLESVIQAPEEDWNKLLIEGLTVGKGEITPEEFYAVIKKRIERVLIRTEGGSYQQRIVTEYLKGIQSRTEEVVHAIQGTQ